MTGPEALVADDTIVWYQRFEIADGVMAPGHRDVGEEWQRAQLPADSLSGRSVLDIGTTNGGAAFMAERLGASRVVATDLLPIDTFGFDRISRAIGSSVEFVQTDIYQLPSQVRGPFDLVIFWGVLYHLRHPLLGLDAVRDVAADVVSIESAVMVGEERNVAEFFRYDELSGDGTNWFRPSASCLISWCGSAGLDAELVAPATGRATLKARVVDREFLTTAAGYEQRLIQRL